MGRDRAAYMREYRKRRKEDQRLVNVMVEATWGSDAARIAELEEEVRHLKAELAKRPQIVSASDHSGEPHLRPYNTRPFTPVPKKK